MLEKLQKNNTFFKLIILSFLLLNFRLSFSQPDLTLTITDLLNWQVQPSYQTNISTEPLHQKVMYPNAQLTPSLDTNARILYSPDGMNNFGPYIDSSHTFNLFNFSHWQYIDILAWFGGSASSPVIIPAKAWVDAAHKNGVKVIGTVFFAPIVYGGSQSAVQSFLQQDTAGNFIAASKLIQIASYYNFDGWILNFETPVNSATGALASSFVNKLDSIYTGEVIWYDAMLQSGTISYQNKLNANNAYFFQHSTGLFTNYAWTSANTVTSSHNYAVGLNLSPFKVYTGADMWPTRNAQPAFSNYQWIDKIITGGIAKTSIALFATNFTFNYGPFSNFNNDSADYNSFYATERQIFSGIDQDPFITDNSAWKGISNYIAVRTPVTSFPFETDFNTGHGLNYYDAGSILIPGAWHNMSHQSILPSWTFYSNGVTMNYDFTAAYSGGSSVTISSSSAGTYNIPLYSTDLITSSSLLTAELALKSSSMSIDSISIELKRKNNIASVVSVFHPGLTGNWEDLLNNNLSASAFDTIIELILNIHSSGAFNMNIGKIGLSENAVTDIANSKQPASSLLFYPNPSSGTVFMDYNGNETGELSIFNLKGEKVLSKTINPNETQKIILPADNVYLYEFNSGKEIKHGKLIVN